MTLNCTNQFKLLEPHVCAYDPNLPPPPLPESRAHVTTSHVQSTPGGPPESLKRKASAAEENPKEKRAKVVQDSVAGGRGVDRRLFCFRMQKQSHTTLRPEVRPPRPSASASAMERSSSTAGVSKKSNGLSEFAEPMEHKAVQLLEAHKAEVCECDSLTRS